MKKLHENIKLARLGLHLSQEYVAKQLNINRTSVVQIEAGSRKVTAEEAEKFSKLFGIPVDELLNGREAIPPETVFAREFNKLDEDDQKEILNLVEFKRIMKEQRAL